ACFGHRLFFFFQAEDGIRDRNVTGVQTCALPICRFRFLDMSAVCWAACVSWTVRINSARSFLEYSAMARSISVIRVRTASARMRCCVPQSVPHGILLYWLQVNCGSRLPLLTRWTYILPPQSAQYIRPVRGWASPQPSGY